MFGRTASVPALLIEVPDAVPVLARGRHRNPRRGACFMEMASFLAGERWSDHPECTHPLLASLARCVNDALDDDSRQRLSLMIPDVVGLNPKDPRVAPSIVREAALAALPVASAERQNVMAIALITCEHTLADLDGTPPDVLSHRARQALDEAPSAEHWARQFIARSGMRREHVRPEGGAKITALAVTGIAQACIPDTEDRLVALLDAAIATTRRHATPVRGRQPSASAPRPEQSVTR